MYPPGFETNVDPGATAEPLEGAGRPGHFRGVCTVVAKLFNAVRPDVAVFGQKDYQQLAVIRRMVVDLDMGIEIVGVPTVRESDGLARSSRNRRLEADHRAVAGCIARGLGAARQAFADGERNAERLALVAAGPIEAEPLAKLEYLAVNDAVTLEAVDVVTRPVVMSTAVWFGEVRLIDNIVLEPRRARMADPGHPALAGRAGVARTPSTARVPLAGDAEADVVIVGGGLTGLWTAWYLAERRPQWRIVVLEAGVVGAGASGRNGGWCSALLPMGLGTIAHRHGRGVAHHAQVAMDATVDEVGAVVAAEGIDCRYAKGGSLDVARSAAQAARLRARWPAITASASATTTSAGSTPARPARGRDERRPRCGAHPPVRRARPRPVGRRARRRGRAPRRGRPRALPRRADRARVRPRRRPAPCAPASSCGPPRRSPSTCRGLRRSVVPIYSLMIATEPLDEATLAEIGLARRETFADGRRLVIYGQRTADGRIAFGGRGAPYHFASRMRPAFEHDEGVHERLRATLVELFPVLADAAITHRWGGAVAAARDWWCSIGFDRGNGIAWAGGYVGDGVAAANLAGRTLAELLTDERSALSRAAVGGPPQPALGGRAVALVGDQRDGPPHRSGRPLRGAHRAGRPLARRARRAGHRVVVSRSSWSSAPAR